MISLSVMLTSLLNYIITVKLSIANVTTDKYVIFLVNNCLTCIYLETKSLHHHQCIAFDRDITVGCTEFNHISLISKNTNGNTII